MFVLESTKRIIDVRGSAFSMGMTQGKAFRYEVKKILAGIKSIPVYPSYLQALLPLSVYKSHLRKIGKKFLKKQQGLLVMFQGLDLYQRLEGLAQGLEIDIELAYGFHALEIESAFFPEKYSYGGCTSILPGNKLSPSLGNPIFYNHDFPESFGPFLYVRRNFPEKGYDSLSLTYPCIMGAIAGVNEQGLAVTVNHAYEKKPEVGDALIITILLQSCLDRCATVDEAVKLVMDTPVPNGSFLSFTDKSGRQAVVEMSSKQKVVRTTEIPFLYTFNQYKTPELMADEVSLSAQGKGPLAGHLIHEHNISRSKRFLEIIQSRKNISRNDLLEILKDHDKGAGNLGTLCRHDPQTSSTLASVIVDPVGLQMEVVFGSPCKSSHWKKYVLKEPIDHQVKNPLVKEVAV